MFEAGRDYTIESLSKFENSVFVFGKAKEKHKRFNGLCYALFDNGECIFDKRCVASGKERFRLKEEFENTIFNKGIDIEKDLWKLPAVKVSLGISQKRFGHTMGKKELDMDIAEQDFNNLLKCMRAFSERQGKTVLVAAHFDQYDQDTARLSPPHCHILYNKFTKFEKNSLGDFLIF